MTKHLVITALGEDKPGIVNEITKALKENGCNLEDSRMSVLGGEFALILMASGNWNTIAKLESQLSALQDRLGMHIFSKHTEPRKVQKNIMPYSADVISMDHPGIVHNLSGFFSDKKINIEELATSTYSGAHTGTPMFSVHMEVGVPSETNIAELREAFMDFCDNLNLDAVLEPIKN
ncbi:MAG: glycine cleavage system protein R [Gammaproteobacteria bacterium]|nr:glycine cleavage system protein R [Gammaproteobacteria bacterium]